METPPSSAALGSLFSTAHVLTCSLGFRRVAPHGAKTAKGMVVGPCPAALQAGRQALRQAGSQVATRGEKSKRFFRISKISSLLLDLNTTFYDYHLTHFLPSKIKQLISSASYPSP